MAWPVDIRVTNTRDHTFVVCDKAGSGTVFVRHMSIDPSGRRGGYKITDLTVEGDPYTPEGEVLPHPAADAFVRPASKFELDAQVGMLYGYSTRLFVGYNLDVDSGGANAAPQPVWTGGGAFSFLAAPTALRIRSTSALDTALGTGAQALRLTVLDAAYKESTITIPLAGTAPVAIGTWLRVNDFLCLRPNAATPGYNEGEIIVETLGGVRVDHCPPRAGRSTTAAFTVPAGFDAFLSFFRCSMYREATAAANVRFELMAWAPGLTWHTRGHVVTHMHGTPYVVVHPSVPFRISEKTDLIVIAAECSTNNTQAYSTGQLILRSHNLQAPAHGYVHQVNAIELETGEQMLAETGEVLEIES